MNEQAIGTEAKNLLDAPAFRLAIDALERGYIEKWRNSRANDTDERERAYMSLQVLEDLTRELRVLADNAKVETAKKTRATRKKAS